MDWDCVISDGTIDNNIYLYAILGMLAIENKQILLTVLQPLDVSVSYRI